jgi:hypothetical protein
MTYGFCATTWQMKKVVLLATSRIYVQNLIPFGKCFDEISTFRSPPPPHKSGAQN